MDLLPFSIWHSTHFYLNCTSTSLLYLLLFSLFSISCIVVATVASRPLHAHYSSHLSHICPISVSPIDELNPAIHFLNYSPTLTNSSNSTHTYTDLDFQTNSNKESQSPDSVQLPNLEDTVSEVTLTFGSDKPEVYMKMAQHANTSKFLCRCPCNHRSPELAPFPHVSKTSTISTDLSAPHTYIDVMDTQDSLSSIASNSRHITFQQHPEQHIQVQSPCSVVPCTDDWIIINDLDREEIPCVEQPSTKQIVIKKGLTSKIAYTRMCTMVPFIDPAIIMHWIALKIIVSIYVLAKRLYDRAVDNPVSRIFYD